MNAASRSDTLEPSSTQNPAASTVGVLAHRVRKPAQQEGTHFNGLGLETGEPPCTVCGSGAPGKCFKLVGSQRPRMRSTAAHSSPLPTICARPEAELRVELAREEHALTTKSESAHASQPSTGYRGLGRWQWHVAAPRAVRVVHVLTAPQSKSFPAVAHAQAACTHIMVVVQSKRLARHGRPARSKKLMRLRAAARPSEGSSPCHCEFWLVALVPFRLPRLRAPSSSLATPSVRLPRRPP